jgi:pimeloyl-ACP methyl ester carboxylesterase
MTTFVLVHGAWHGAWCWERVHRILTRRGHEVAAPELPSDSAGAGSDEYLAAITDTLKPRSGVVLVAHSMGALVAPLAVADPAVTSLVLLAGLMPRPGTSLLEAVAEPYAEPMRQSSGQLIVDEYGRTTLPADTATSLFYNDCSPADAADAVARLRPDSTVIYGQVMPGLPGRRVPATYISCRRDQVIDGSWGSRVARDLLGADVRELDTGHSPFWSAPDALADLLEALR